jgi:hypothetical protein
MSQLPLAAKVFIVLTVLAGIAILAYGLVHLQPAAPLPLAVFLVVGVAASRLKVGLPGVNGTMSVNLPFLLIAAAQLSVPEALLVACLGSVAQSLGRSGRAKPVQLVFNSAVLINAVGLAAITFAAALRSHFAAPLAIIAGAGAYFLANTLPVAAVLWLAEGEKPLLTWRRIADLTLPYYLLSACLAAIVCAGSKSPMWTVALALLVVMYLTYRSYRVYFSRPVSDSRPTEGNMAKASPEPSLRQATVQAHQ